MEKEMRSLADNDNLQEEHECPGCGQPTSGTYTESGSKTALCEDCFNTSSTMIRINKTLTPVR